MTLCVVLDEPVDNRRAIDRLRHRLNTGARYARSGVAYDEHPDADRLLPFRLAVIAKAPVSSIERQNLDGIRLQYRYTDIRFDVEGVEPGRRTPVGLTERPACSAGCVDRADVRPAGRSRCAAQRGPRPRDGLGRGLARADPAATARTPSAPDPRRARRARRDLPGRDEARPRAGPRLVRAHGKELALPAFAERFVARCRGPAPRTSSACSTRGCTTRGRPAARGTDLTGPAVGQACLQRMRPRPERPSIRSWLALAAALSPCSAPAPRCRARRPAVRCARGPRHPRRLRRAAVVRRGAADVAPRRRRQRLDRRPLRIRPGARAAALGDAAQPGLAAADPSGGRVLRRAARRLRRPLALRGRDAARDRPAGQARPT